MEQLLIEKVVEGINVLYGESVSNESVQVQNTRKDFEGDATVVTFPFLRQSKKSPEQTGEELGAFLKESVSEIASFNTVKGFLNLS
ncbi:MAG: arginine--tRNA ligase, partial [Flavobacteriales bacterium]|nr:arginine--tRNA ligase [Flavobacteriales bacterium]